jgi:integrase
MSIIEQMHPHYRNVTRFMFLTGLSASEVADLEPADIQGDILELNTFIAHKREKDEGKSEYRARGIPITRAIRACLDEALATTKGKTLFMTVTGLPFQEGTYRKNYWQPALKRAGLRYIKPYSTRHTFAAWALVIGMNPNQLVPLMGHGSKKMVYEVYGEYTAGLAQDREKILSFLGKDFLIA